MKGIYMMIGYPDIETFKDEFIFSQNSGLDFVEIGLPFNDPVADGPVISEAGEKVLKNGINTEELMEFIRRNKKTKIYIMTYSNIIYRFGAENFSKKYKDTLDGVIVADLPNEYHYFFKEKGFEIPTIPFAATDTDVGKLTHYLNGQDFIYFVGLKGVTGSKADLNNQVNIEKIKEIKEATGYNVIFGFGIKTPDDASAVMKFADGFVVGTEVVKRQTEPEEFKKFVKSLAESG